MKPEIIDTIYIIREVASGKAVKFGAKAAWATHGAAKNALHLHMKDNVWRLVEYKVVPLDWSVLHD